MKIEELENEKMCALFAPDGSFQAMTLAPDFPSCVAQIKMLHGSRMCQSYHKLSLEGFKILPVKITMIQDGTEEDLFNETKQRINQFNQTIT
jgi:hypothetical protein